MKALLPYNQVSKSDYYEGEFYWFVKCPDCGVMVASGIFNQVDHAKKFHGLGNIVEAMKREFQNKKKPVSEISEIECDELIERVFSCPTVDFEEVKK